MVLNFGPYGARQLSGGLNRAIDRWKMQQILEDAVNEGANQSRNPWRIRTVLDIAELPATSALAKCAGRRWRDVIGPNGFVGHRVGFDDEVKI